MPNIDDFIGILKGMTEDETDLARKARLRDGVGLAEGYRKLLMRACCYGDDPQDLDLESLGEGERDVARAIQEAGCEAFRLSDYEARETGNRFGALSLPITRKSTRLTAPTLAELEGKCRALGVGR